MVDFQREHGQWLERQLAEQTGESKRRLEEGHGQAERMFLEKIWWPAVGSLAGLHAEYEVKDNRDGTRYVDFAYMRGEFRAAIEIDGYGPHWRDISRRQFGDQWFRQNSLVLAGWRVLRFAYDDLSDRTRSCQTTIQQLLGLAGIELGKLEREASQLQELTMLERELVRSLRKGYISEISPVEFSKQFRICRATAYRVLRRLVDAGLIEPSKPNLKRTRKYRLSYSQTI